MKYRVIVKIGYNEAWFDFDDMQEAGEFAKTVLTHQVDSEDAAKSLSVRIDVMVKGENVCE